MSRSRVDLPQPEGPISDTNSPRRISRLMSVEGHRGGARAPNVLSDAGEGDDRLPAVGHTPNPSRPAAQDPQLDDPDDP